MKLFSAFVTCAILGLAVPASGQATGVVIQEFVADNKHGLRDEDGAASDWLELHNPTDAPVSLGGTFLTDSAENLSKWPLPDMVLPAHGYRVIFASGKDRRDPSGTLHSNFALSKNGEFLGLTSQGLVLSGFVPSFPAQVEDVSYGFASSQSRDLVFMLQPTPGAANQPASAVPGAVAVAPAGGTFSGSLDVTMEATSSGAVIHYTLDGSVPTAASPVYSGPLHLESSTRLRAVALAHGLMGTVSGADWVRLAPDAASYQSTLPLVVIDNFNGGIVPSKGFPTQDGSNTQQVVAQAAVWVLQETDGATARLAGPPQLSGGIGIRGRGSLSTTWSRKPYAIECRAPDGTSTEAAPFGFPSNDDWVLYYPDPGFLRDPTLIGNTFIYELSRRLGRYAPRFRFVELFLNEDGGDLTMADRRGVYVLMEKISRGKNRLDFDPLSADGTSGGALLAINRMDPIPETGFPAANGAMTPQFFRTAGPDRIFQTADNVATLSGDDLPGYNRAFLNFEQPGGYRISAPQRSAIQTWFQQFEDALYDQVHWQDPALGWRQWLVEEDWTAGYLLNNFTRHTDALQLSIYPWLGNDRKLRLGPIWDVTPGSYTEQGGPDSALYYRAGQLWFPRLFQDPDFKQTYLDQWTRWRRGSFSHAAMESIIDRQAAQITAAKAVSQGIASAAEWQTRLNAMKTWVKGRAAYFDQSFVALPVIQPAGGIVAAGTPVQIGSSAPEWWVTTDGSDPRLAGGAVSPHALALADFVVTEDVRLTVRSRSGGEWSGPAVAAFAVDAVAARPGLPVISEIHYHPAAPDAVAQAAGFADREAFEFIELHNPGGQKISLHDLRLVLDRGLDQAAWEGVTADRWTLPPGGRLVLVRDRAAFVQRYGAAGPLGGVYQGSLSNASAVLELEKSDGTLVGSVVYGSVEPWPSSADGAGYSLTLRDGVPPLQATSWRTSVALHGTPGSSDAVPYPGPHAADWKSYAFGSTASPILMGVGAPAGLSLVIPPGADTARYAVEESADLLQWSPAAWTGPVETRVPSGAYLLSWKPPAGDHLPFLRLRATPAP